MPVAIIATTHYDATAAWRPEPRSKAAGVMILLAHSGLARRDPARALRSIHRAVEHAQIFDGPRGEAEPAARALLAGIEAWEGPRPTLAP